VDSIPVSGCPSVSPVKTPSPYHLLNTLLEHPPPRNRVFFASFLLLLLTLFEILTPLFHCLSPHFTSVPTLLALLLLLFDSCSPPTDVL
jgi:hypothetical protein